MKIKLGDLEIILGSLNKIIDKEIPVKVSFLFSRLYKKLVEELNIFEESRKKLLIKYGEINDKGELQLEDNMVKFKNVEDKTKFNDEFIGLLNVEIDVNWELIDIDKLGDIEITPKDLINLSILFKD